MSDKMQQQTRAAVWGNLGPGVASNKILAPKATCPHDEEGTGPCARCAMGEIEEEGFEAILLADKDVEHVVRQLTPSQRDLLICRPEKAMIAGGYIRSCITGDRLRDVDYFVATKQDAFDMCEGLLNWEEVGTGTAKAKLVRQTEYAYTAAVPGQLPVQFIHRFPFTNPVEVISMFDFTVSQAAVWYGLDSKWRGICAKTYYEDLAAKRLVYTNPEGREGDQDIQLMFRILKHHGMGYHIDVANLAYCLARAARDITKLPINIGVLSLSLQEKALKFSLSPDFEKLCKPSVTGRTLDKPKKTYDDDWS